MLRVCVRVKDRDVYPSSRQGPDKAMMYTVSTHDLWSATAYIHTHTHTLCLWETKGGKSEKKMGAALSADLGLLRWPKGG